jgi:hypothetical protein
MSAIVCDFALCKSRHGPCRVMVYDDQAVANRSDKKMDDQGCSAIYLWDLLMLRSGGVVYFVWLPVAEIASKS